MKKLLSLFALLAIFAGCSDNDEPTKNDDLKPTFIGKLEVTPQPGSPFGEFSEQDIEFNYEVNAEKLTLVMPKIKFVAEMPRWIAFEVRELNYQRGDSQLTFSIDETIPYWNGAPYDPNNDGKYKITNLVGRHDISSGKLYVEFDCYSMHVNYVGDYILK